MEPQIRYCRTSDGVNMAYAVEGEGPVLIYASAPPETVAQVQQALGRERAGALIEQAMAEIGRGPWNRRWSSI